MSPDRCPACHGSLTQIRANLYGESSLYRCANCATECLAPQPSDERLAEIYSSSYYDPWAVEQDSSLEPMKRGTFAWILDQCPLKPGARVLDLGCATGFLLRLALERGLVAYGIDLNSYAIEQCRTIVPEAQVHCGVLADGPFADVDFDAVFMIDFIEHVRDPEAELRCVASRLSPGGAAVISTPRTDSLVHAGMRGGWLQYKEEHLTYFSLPGLTALLRRVGLQVVIARPTRKTMTLGYAHRLLQAYRHPLATPVFSLLWGALPFLRDRRFPVRLGEMTVVARTRDGTPGAERADHHRLETQPEHG